MNTVKRIGVLGGSFDPPTISHLQLASETLNMKVVDEIWMIPCGHRSDKQNQVAAEKRLEMVQAAVNDYFPRNFPIKVDDIEVKNGKQIQTYYLLQMLQEQHGPNYHFVFMIGSDLVPSLHTWHPKMISEPSFIIFDRKGYEHILDPATSKDYPIPHNYTLIKAN